MNRRLVNLFNFQDRKIDEIRCAASVSSCRIAKGELARFVQADRAVWATRVSCTGRSVCRISVCLSQPKSNFLGKSVEISQQQSRELHKLGGRLACKFFFLMQGIVAVKADPMRPGFQILRDLASVREPIDSLLEFPRFNVRTELLEGNFQTAPKHSCGGCEIASTQTSRPLLICSTRSLRDVLRSWRLLCLWKHCCYEIALCQHQVPNVCLRVVVRRWASDFRIYSESACRANGEEVPQTALRRMWLCEGDVKRCSCCKAMRTVVDDGGHELVSLSIGTGAFLSADHIASAVQPFMREVIA
ncbi:hypothetical protein BBQ_2041 [Burkholderia pseudomallei MSHR511]|uniref:Uncharacterized protein n=1 Tax=Burkholderia pseudomallei TaxID=28450 RepID=A0AA40J8K8_BURPE|nr:hypothetical protein BBS_107 [Burkholderia pseudomallei NAU20B-16]AHG35632.1 hypothetical protein BBQ_2041 [Burkholderia pseudomallei MSHR511]AHG69257.1 hypothetical protein BBN_2167 [Burkholderia pseudomallei MSHR146]AIP23642.1 hypothetical protein DP63_2837 [Burkholderia pseudomallei MSHR5855]AIP39570.1 hypothetical protein DP65_388 [Burkholderia pseudomallei MSHR5848]KGX05981.1 hypothetical protein Y036_622 [Burkholderia pseudomallei]